MILSMQAVQSKPAPFATMFQLLPISYQPVAPAHASVIVTQPVIISQLSPSANSYPWALTNIHLYGKRMLGMPNTNMFCHYC